MKQNAYLCQRFGNTGCSAVRLAHLLWEQGVEGSNPFTPTADEGSHQGHKTVDGCPVCL